MENQFSDKLLVLVLLQQVLSLQEKLRSKEAELERVREEHRSLEGQMHVLQAKVCPPFPRRPG